MSPDKKTYQKPRIERVALAQRVLVVAKPGGVGDWAAYIDAVPGMYHAREWQAVVDDGSKLGKSLACFLFPQFDPDLFRE